MDRKILFYGTPLSKILTTDDDKARSYGPISNRRARLNKQQTVRDAQGRQRFHGAFTGGFSAGYHNTVDSVEGFQPRQFISTRQNRYVEGNIHKPEDYMDDEDFGEFGIAPKKLRIINQHTCNLDLASSRINPEFAISNVKNDYHGLGYKGLRDRRAIKTDPIQNKNSLEAVLNEGRRLAISGEAFGQGVLENQDDFIDAKELYGYENIQDFVSTAPKPSSSRHKLQEFTDEDDFNFDRGYIKGFVPAKNVAATECDSSVSRFPLPIIESNWVMPMRKMSTLPARCLSQDNEKLESQSSLSPTLFSRKFTVASHSLHDSEEVGFKSGLVPYSDLKATYPKLNQNDPPLTQEEQARAAIVQKLLEWRPCSLLCKRFNVPNPFPDNSFVGIRNTEELPDKPSVCVSTGVEDVGFDVDEGQALLNLKRSIFNVDFSSSQLQIDDNDQETNSEDEPQVLEVGSVSMHDLEKKNNVPSDEDPDIIVVSVPLQPEPEVITLSSSSSSSPTPSNEIKSVEEIEESDIYGPPIPPSMKTLIDLDSHQSRIRHESSKRKRKKNKKHKRHKRRQTPTDN